MPVRKVIVARVTYPLSQINTMDRRDFVRIVGPIIEHSPWVAKRAEARRPFASLAALHTAFCEALANATTDEQLAVIRAHPDLVGNAVLTAESKGEQAAAGLSDLSAEEVALFDRCNRDYKARFSFPFVICARLNKKDAILAALPVRLKNTADAERLTALSEICKIARLRLSDLIA